MESTERLLDRLTSAMARFQEQLDRVYRQQREREEARRLRNDQVFFFVYFWSYCHRFTYIQCLRFCLPFHVCLVCRFFLCAFFLRFCGLCVYFFLVCVFLWFVCVVCSMCVCVFLLLFFASSFFSLVLVFFFASPAPIAPPVSRYITDRWHTANVRVVVVMVFVCSWYWCWCW